MFFSENSPFGPAGDTTATRVACVGREIPLGCSEGGTRKVLGKRGPLGMVGSMPLSCLLNTLPVGVFLTYGDDIPEGVPILNTHVM